MLVKRVQKIQRKINKKVKAMNKSIETDDLWLGRFYARQKSRKAYQYEDKSGYCVFVTITIFDKKTGFSKDFRFDHYDILFGGWKLWEAMNNFIIEDCKVWEEDPRPSLKTAIDYRKVKVN